MASPNFDTIHLRLSRYLNDAVATASTDGSQFTSAQRSDYLNRASSYLQTSIYTIGGRDVARSILQSILKTQSFTFSNAGVAVASDYNNFPIALSKVSSTILYQYWERKEELDANVNPNIASAYTVENGKIYAYESGVILNAGTGNFKYLTNDAGVQGTTDIAISPNLWDTIVDLAASFAFDEIGSTQDAQTYLARAFQAMATLLRK